MEYSTAFNSVTVYSTVFALNKDVSLDTLTYFKYNIDMINPAGAAQGRRLGKDDVRGLERFYSSSSARDTRHALTAGFSQLQQHNRSRCLL